MELMEYEKKHTEAVKGSLAECTVLLKKDGRISTGGGRQDRSLW